MIENKTIQIDYDDLPDDIINKINKLLSSYNLKLEFDGEFHDGFEIIHIKEL